LRLCEKATDVDLRRTPYFSVAEVKEMVKNIGAGMSQLRKLHLFHAMSEQDALDIIGAFSFRPGFRVACGTEGYDKLYECREWWWEKSAVDNRLSTYAPEHDSIWFRYVPHTLPYTMPQ
jgi:hypothetical protein